MKLSKFTTDKQREDEGVEVNLGREGDGAELILKVGRWGNSRARVMLERLTSAPAYQRAMRMNTLTEAESVNVIASVLAECCLFGWQGLEDDNGKPIPYSKEKAKELLATVPDFRRLVYECCNDLTLFRASNIEAAQDALKKSSRGTSSSQPSNANS